MPILLYGADIWSTTRNNESRIQSLEIKILRAMVAKTKRQFKKRDEGEIGSCCKINLHRMEASRLK